jgi:two-component system LytT family response regulator
MEPITASSPGVLLLHTCKGVELVQISNIVRIEAISNYSKLFFAGGKTLVVAKVLKWFDKILTEKNFVRIHRSHLINLSCISSYNNINRQKIILYNEEQINISRRKRSSIIKRLAIPTAA